ncbi:MAG: SulP family inorganic anion transporter [Lentisphaeria bacterium]|nr:SulP family inorganic anion transporter [Lentisphaeria bacterium]
MLKISGKQIKNEILSGLTVALALVPEAVAFAFVAGVDPIAGLYAAFFVGFITSLIGGRPGMISGATGAMAVVMTGFVTIYGIEYLFAAVVVTGLLQIGAGLFKLGKFIRLLPLPVMLGFVNGLAIVIGKAQFGQFKINEQVVFDDQTLSFITKSDWMNFTSPALWIILGFILLTMAICYFLPKLTKALPAPLVAIVVCTLLASTVPALSSKTVDDVVNSKRKIAKIKENSITEFAKTKDTLMLKDIKQAGDSIAQSESKKKIEVRQGLEAGLPTFHIPSITWDFHSIKVILLLALTLASIGLIESLMTLSLIDEMTNTRGQGNRECIGQGVANVVTGFFSGMGGCAMIGQSMININSGGKHRLSGISAAIFLLIFILFTPALIGMIPIAALIGVMFMVVIATFEWSSLRLFGKAPKSDILVVILVTVITVILDLAIAVGVGIVISALVYAWNSAKDLRLKEVPAEKPEAITCYEITGNLFFGSITNFRDLFTPENDKQDIYIDFKAAKVCDHSGIEAVHNLSERYKTIGKTLHLRHLSPECNQLLEQAGDLVEVNKSEDPNYHVADNALA